jgi:hypothetical protein
MNPPNPDWADQIKEILLQVEPDAGELPDQFLRVICEQTAQGEKPQITKISLGDSFLSWDQITQIGEVATLISTCLTIAKTSFDLANIKRKLPQDKRTQNKADRILQLIIPK